jgi:hypothetical protein
MAKPQDLSRGQKEAHSEFSCQTASRISLQRNYSADDELRPLRILHAAMVGGQLWRSLKKQGKIDALV